MQEKFTDKLIIDKTKIIGKINNISLLDYDIVIPNEQRITCQQKIEEIMEYQESYFKKKNKFNFLGLINIHYNSQTNYFI